MIKYHLDLDYIDKSYYNENKALQILYIIYP
jgi:hypothetical protein